jgi:hypothetical protein
MNCKRIASATIAIAKTKDRSIELMVKSSVLKWLLSAGGRAGKAEQVTSTPIAGVAIDKVFSDRGQPVHRA